MINDKNRNGTLTLYDVLAKLCHTFITMQTIIKMAAVMKVYDMEARLGTGEK